MIACSSPRKRGRVIPEELERPQGNGDAAPERVIAASPSVYKVTNRKVLKEQKTSQGGDGERRCYRCDSKEHLVVDQDVFSDEIKM
ncbi:hypothetical protein NDU88_010181 [Pleurodeles waltl]|uniref:Uncharacterized protein n=1 Tax=Pleurodeles waltl TaxID=8319 RepID=A0AAV7RXF0_PLEWA|nr:hypothetical protein NDU88_010181 [Pleurodeles waltl]